MTMNREPTEPEAELRRIVRLLEKTAKMAEHATLTGSLSNGKAYAIRSYNAVVEHLASTMEIPAALFPLLAESASLGDVGIASAQLAEYLRAGLPESGVGDAVIGRFINKGDLAEIAEMAREHVLDQIRRKFRERSHDPAPPAAPRAPAAPSRPAPPAGAPGTPPPPVAQLWHPPQSAGLEELRPEQREAGPGAPGGESGGVPSPSPAERRREILEALNAGRLTAEEAAAQLEAL
jgi:hypothetical protein